MRWSYITPRFVFVLIIYLFFYFAFDPILKWGFVKSLEALFEAKSEIKTLKTKFFPPSIIIKELSVGNKDKEFNNLFEFNEARFRLNGKAILEKKFVIEEATIKGLSFDTPRKKSCKIKIKKTKMPEFVGKFMDTARISALEKIDDMKSDAISEVKVNVENLSSIKLMDELKNRYEEEYKNIDKKIDFNRYELRIKEIDKKLESVKKEKNFIKQLKLSADLKKDIENLYKDFRKDKKEVEKLIDEAKNYYKEVNEARNADINKIMSMAKIPSIDRESVASMIVGKDVFTKAAHYYYLASKATKYIPTNAKKKIFEEKRKRGRIVLYEKENTYPSFLLKLAHIDGVLTPSNPIEYSATLSNLTAQPKLYPHPLKLELYGKKETSQVSVLGMADFSLQPYTSTLNIKYIGAKLSDLSYGSERLKIDVKKSLVDTFVVAKTVSDNIDISVKSSFSDVLITPYVNISEKYGELNKTIENSLSKIQTFNINFYLSGSFSNPSFKVETDLADVVLNSLGSIFRDKIDSAKKQISEKIDAEINKNKEKLDRFIKDNQEALKNKLKLDSEKLDNWKKEIEKKIKI
ncbi:MAG: TIGR03545 family protein [Elusimicrobiota bacterium]